MAEIQYGEIAYTAIVGAAATGVFGMFVEAGRSMIRAVMRPRRKAALQDGWETWKPQRRRNRVLFSLLVVALSSAAGAAAAVFYPKVIDALRPLQAQQPFRDCDECPEMVRIPGGAYQRGSPEGVGEKRERPRREVTIAEFAAATHEVTLGEWKAFVADTGRAIASTGPSWRDPQFTQDPSFRQGDDHPVVRVTWRDSQDYVRWLSEKTGKSYRLLTEAEWEYAARGGDRAGSFAWGDIATHDKANYLDDEDGADEWPLTAPVGSFAPNRFGLYDMHGNVWELVEDCEGSYADAPVDGSAFAKSDCATRIMRGGSWAYNGATMRSANRGRAPQNVAGSNQTGFRVARSL